MPINEAVQYRGGLTPKQKNEQLAALYGCTPEEQMTPTPQFTHEEIARMKQIIAVYDGQNSLGNKEFDLSNPPVPPYRHQEFPRHVHNHVAGKFKVVNNEDELTAATAKGWKLEAPAPVQDNPLEGPPLDPAAQAEADELDARLAEANAKPKKAK